MYINKHGNTHKCEALKFRQSFKRKRFRLILFKETKHYLESKTNTFWDVNGYTANFSKFRLIVTRILVIQKKKSFNKVDYIQYGWWVLKKLIKIVTPSVIVDVEWITSSINRLNSLAWTVRTVEKSQTWKISIQ